MTDIRIPASAVSVHPDPIRQRIEQYDRDLDILDKEAQRQREALSKQFQQDMRDLLPIPNVYTWNLPPNAQFVAGSGVSDRTEVIEFDTDNLMLNGTSDAIEAEKWVLREQQNWIGMMERGWRTFWEKLSDGTT